MVGCENNIAKQCFRNFSELLGLEEVVGDVLVQPVIPHPLREERVRLQSHRQALHREEGTRGNRPGGDPLATDITCAGTSATLPRTGLGNAALIPGQGRRSQ